MRTDDILNFIRIDARTASGGQPTEEQLVAARDEGYDAVINLAPASSGEGALTDEAGVLRELGIEYHHIPVAWTAPLPEDFQNFSEIMDRLAARDRKVLIHCAANFRVTAFYSLYGMKNLGWSRTRADAFMAPVWESRPDYRMDDTWRSFIEQRRADLGV